MVMYSNLISTRHQPKYAPITKIIYLSFRNYLNIFRFTRSLPIWQVHELNYFISFVLIIIFNYLLSVFFSLVEFLNLFGTNY